MSTEPTFDARRLVELTAPDEQDLTTLHRRLESSAVRDGLLDVAYTTMDTPVGPLLLAATPAGLVRVAYEVEGFDRVLETLTVRLSPRVLRAPGRLSSAVQEIEEYFTGTRTGFDLPLDFSLSSGFRQLVQRHLTQIPYGRTESYKEVASVVGNPRAVRAVGSACATNPLPVVVPCHRVLRTGGALGGYVGGLEVKTALLALESAA
jgi:methylated-DNA-[protein]-cysteine S-methyltransferase